MRDLLQRCPCMWEACCLHCLQFDLPNLSLQWFLGHSHTHCSLFSTPAGSWPAAPPRTPTSQSLQRSERKSASHKPRCASNRRHTGSCSAASALTCPLCSLVMKSLSSSGAGRASAAAAARASAGTRGRRQQRRQGMFWAMLSCRGSARCCRVRLRALLVGCKERGWCFVCDCSRCIWCCNNRRCCHARATGAAAE